MEQKQSEESEDLEALEEECYRISQGVSGKERVLPFPRVESRLRKGKGRAWVEEFETSEQEKRR